MTRDADSWTSTTFGGGERVELPSLGLSPSMDDIYADMPVGGRS